MQVIYNVKPHQAYVRRERNDKQLEMIVKKLEEGDTNKKLVMEQHAIQEYVRKKEIDDKMQDENKQRRLRQMEHEMKRTLDRQVQEKGIQGKLQKFSEGLDTVKISQDYIDF